MLCEPRLISQNSNRNHRSPWARAHAAVPADARLCCNCALPACRMVVGQLRRSRLKAYLTPTGIRSGHCTTTPHNYPVEAADARPPNPANAGPTSTSTSRRQHPAWIAPARHSHRSNQAQDIPPHHPNGAPSGRTITTPFHGRENDSPKILPLRLQRATTVHFGQSCKIIRMPADLRLYTGNGMLE